MTTVTFPRPCDDKYCRFQDLSDWLAGKNYTLKGSVTETARSLRIELAEDLDAAQKTQLTADLRDELIYPVMFA